MKRFSLLILIGLILMTSISGCNTLRGAGEDIENAGEHIQDATK